MPRRGAFRIAGKLLKRFDVKKVSLKIQLKEDYDFSIANTRLISSRGILSACDIKPDLPKSSSIDTVYLNAIPDLISNTCSNKKFVSIYVCSDSLDHFSSHVLPRINKKFTLVSGDSDLSINQQSLGNAFLTIASHPLLLRWFAQNLDTAFDKLEPLPIGLDFHSTWYDPRIWGGGFLLPNLQEAQLREILLEAPLPVNRKPFAYCDWLGSLDRGDRRKCLEQISASCIAPQKERCTRIENWINQSQFQYVVSPKGRGIDCHRTWEAIALGCIPIVFKSHLSPLFSHLPVIELNHWDELNQSLLENAFQGLLNRKFNLSTLLLSYWKSRINGYDSSSRSINDINLHEFRNFY